MNIVKKIKAAVLENPEIYVSEMARKLGVSRQYIHQICKKHEIKLIKGWDRKELTDNAIERSKSIYHFGAKASCVFIGGASELTASADLLRRGIPVYRALAFVGPADLVINLDGKLLRVEVRSARRKKDGGLSYCTPPINEDRYDVLALVEPNGGVTYKPDILADDYFHPTAITP